MEEEDTNEDKIEEEVHHDVEVFDREMRVHVHVNYKVPSKIPYASGGFGGSISQNLMNTESPLKVIQEGAAEIRKSLRGHVLATKNSGSLVSGEPISMLEIIRDNLIGNRVAIVNPTTYTVRTTLSVEDVTVAPLTTMQKAGKPIWLILHNMPFPTEEIIKERGCKNINDYSNETGYSCIEVAPNELIQLV